MLPLTMSVKPVAHNAANHAYSANQSRYAKSSC